MDLDENEFVLHSRRQLPPTMAAAAAAVTRPQFPLFANFPYEIRCLIWRAALPGAIGPSLYVYRPGNHRFQPLSPSDDAAFVGDGIHEQLAYSYDLLDAAHFPVPPAFVNREAHALAHTWMRRHGVMADFTNPRHAVFARPFSMSRDAIFIAPDDYEAFAAEHGALVSELELDSWRQAVPRLLRPTFFAVTESLLRKVVCGNNPGAVLSSVGGTLLVVIDEPAGLRSANAADPDQRWEYKHLSDGAFVWDHDSSTWSFSGSMRPGYEERYQMVENDLRSVRSTAIPAGNLTVRLVHAAAGEGVYRVRRSPMSPTYFHKFGSMFR